MMEMMDTMDYVDESNMSNVENNKLQKIQAYSNKKYMVIDHPLGFTVCTVFLLFNCFCCSLFISCFF